MDLSQKTQGAKIAALRKIRNMTQEQLAAQLGISAPAVSKWETGSSYPDITLLAPLARALGTNLDTLLQFEQTLSDQEVATQINLLLQGAAAQGTPEGWQAAENQLNELLHRYPNCTSLQFNGAAFYDTLTFLFPTAGKEQHTRWKERKRQLLEQLRSSGTAAYWQSATMQLASLSIADGALEEGAELLRELPEQTFDPTALWALYYLKKEQPKQALELTQKQLYKLANQILSCLGTLTMPKLMSEPAQQLRLAEAYHTIARTFGMLDSSGGLLCEAYLRMGDKQKAAESFAQYVEELTGPAPVPDKILFSPAITVKDRSEVAQAASREMRQMLLDGIVKDEKYAALASDAIFARALEKLKASLL